MKQESYRLATLLLSCGALILVTTRAARADLTFQRQKGFASWYGDELRGKLMANGKRFDPDKLTAASWFYPLGTRVRVTIRSPEAQTRSVLVTITDRGPAKRLVDQGRVIDLGRAAFRRIAQPDLGLVEVTVEPVQ
jgi:rare lipoprotein A